MEYDLIAILGTGFEYFDKMIFMDKQNSVNKDDIDAIITPTEKAMLDQSLVNADGLDDDDAHLTDSELDSTDDVSGGDLDIPGAGDDDDDEVIGEEDEENNGYSEADTE